MHFKDRPLNRVSDQTESTATLHSISIRPINDTRYLQTNLLFSYFNFVSIITFRLLNLFGLWLWQAVNKSNLIDSSIYH